MANAPKVCLVRCPRCGQLLPESADCLVYRCGGCGAILQAKRKVQASDCSSEEYYHSSEESDHKRIRRISKISENLSEKATVNLCSTSAWDIKPDVGSLSFDRRGLEGNGTATYLEILSVGDCVSLSAVSSGSIEATKEPVHKPTEILEMTITAKVRLVSRPRCKTLLPESADFPVYQCGGCGAILQAKRKVQASDCLSEESDHKRIRGISKISENLSEKETANLCSTSAWDIKPDVGSLSFDRSSLEGNGTATNLEITSGGDCVSLSAVSSGSIEATKEPVHKSTQIPEMTMLQLDGVTSSTPMSSGYDYDVFLSFRGPDTHSGITNFLYTRLLGAKIHTFKDAEELRVGEEFGPESLEAIRQSKIAIPIFSKGYASSKWCLNQLVQMVQCSKKSRQKIMPIFYDVTPAEVGHQIGSYEEAFLLHEKNFGVIISEWKAALNHVAHLKGWDNLKNDRGEGELVDKIVQEIIEELKTPNLLGADCLVGVEHHVNKIDRMLCGDSEDLKILGIYGMGGVGKTTLAKIIYSRLSNHFEACCFLSGVRETSQLKGVECLQNQLLSDILKRDWPNISNVEYGIKTINDRLRGKKVLVLLDDVDERIHLNALMGRPVWFGKGSILIITSRNMEVFNVPEVCCTYELTGMDFSQSLQLFCKHAFRRDHPLEGYATLSNEVVKMTGGLPLALEVIGLQLFGKSTDFWDVTLQKLEKVPHREVQSKLKVSYDALDYRQKKIFLDIACSYIGCDKGTVLQKWTSDLFPGEALQVLQQRSLIKIGEDNKLWMHPQLRDLGRDIVCQKHNKEL